MEFAIDGLNRYIGVIEMVYREVVIDPDTSNARARE
jgi:hypothetical protein